VSSQTVDEYLRSLGITAETSNATDRTVPRVHQLFQRTNQFNLTGRRYELGELAARAGDAGWRIHATLVSDRFGDHGIVATSVVRAAAEIWSIDNLVMSCRVIGYGIERALLAHLAGEARAGGARWLQGEFIVSAKNKPASDFFERNAFARVSAPDGSERWRLDLTNGEIAPPAWITVSPTHGS
jgi:FkbH-like protein